MSQLSARLPELVSGSVGDLHQYCPKQIASVVPSSQSRFSLASLQGEAIFQLITAISPSWLLVLGSKVYYLLSCSHCMCWGVAPSPSFFSPSMRKGTKRIKADEGFERKLRVSHCPKTKLLLFSRQTRFS